MSCFPCSTRKFIVGRISYRKIYSIAMERKIIICLFLGRLIIAICGQTPILEIFDSDTAEGTEQGSSFTLNCTVTINDIILFKLNDTMQGSCTAPFAGFPGSCIPNTITQSLATSVSSWTISPAEPAHHGFWKCTRGSTDSIAEFLNIYKLPSTIDSQSGISSNIIVNDTSSYPILVDVDCMFSQSGPRMELQFVDGGTSSASVIMSCTTLSTACSPCTGCSAYSCRHTVKLKQDLSSGEIKTNTPYTLRINVGVTGTTQTFSNNVFAPHTITFTRTSQSEAKKSWIHVKVSSVINTVWSAVKWLFYLLWRVLCCLFCKQCCRPFTVIVALAWCYYLSRRYVLNGRVVYGIQIAVVAAISQLVTIISAVIVLTIYEEQNESSVTPIMLSQMPLCALLSVGIFFLWKAYFCQREWTYTEFFKDRLIDCFLSTYGIKFATINKDKIWFKVWAKDDVLLTLFGNNDMPFLYIIMGYGNRNRKFKSISSRPVVACDDVFGTDNKYRTFFLTCEKHCVTVVRVLNGKEETVLKWPLRNCPEPSDIDHSPLNIGDIRISNYMQDLTKKKESKETTETAETTVTEADATKTAITISQSGTSGEWIFFIRKGDCLLEDDDDSRWSKNLTLILVILLPVALIVVAILFIIKLINANGKGEEKGQPNATIAAGDKWMRTDVGKNTLNLPPVDLNKKTDAVPDDTEQTEKKAKSRKKKNRNEIRQTQADTENNTVQTEIVQ